MAEGLLGKFKMMIGVEDAEEEEEEELKVVAPVQNLISIKNEENY